MAHYNQDWDDLGRNIQDIVDRAVNSHDYQRLNQTVRQIVDRAVGAGTEAVRRVTSRPAVSRQVPAAALYGKTGGKTASGVLKTVFGGLLSCFNFFMVFGLTGFHLMIEGSSPLNGTVLFFLLCFLGSVWLTASGVRTLGMIRRFKVYQRILGQKTHCTLEKLARSVGKTVKFVRKELYRMIGSGLFLEGHLDREENCLITSDETYRHFEQSRLQLEQRQRQEAEEKARQAQAAAETPAHGPQVQEVLNRGNAFVAEIRRCNDIIPGEMVSAKIDRMELIVRRIFQRAEAHPEIVPDLKKLMDYYLPMTVKLLNAYADMDAQPIQGQNIENSKREIEATLDTLNLAFEKLLDSVFADTAMDVSSDISVLNTLLAQEGLTEDELTRMRQQNG